MRTERQTSRPSGRPRLSLAPDLLIELRRMFPGRGWVLFEHGTVVLVPDDVRDPSAYARLHLAHCEPFHAGSAAGDGSVMRIDDGDDYLVATPDPDVATIVRGAQLSRGASEATVGTIGRVALEADANGGEPVFVEPPRMTRTH